MQCFTICGHIATIKRFFVGNVNLRWTRSYCAIRGAGGAATSERPLSTVRLRRHPQPQWVTKGSAHVSPSKARRRRTLCHCIVCTGVRGSVLRAHVRSVPGAAVGIRHRGRSEDGAHLAERKPSGHYGHKYARSIVSGRQETPRRLAGQGRCRTAGRRWMADAGQAAAAASTAGEIALVRHLAGVRLRRAFGAEDSRRRA